MGGKMQRKQKKIYFILLTLLSISFTSILNAEINSKSIFSKSKKYYTEEIFTEDDKEIARYYYDKEGIVLKKEGKMPDMTFNYYCDSGDKEMSVTFQNNRIVEKKVYTKKGILSFEASNIEKRVREYNSKGVLIFKVIGDYDIEKKKIYDGQVKEFYDGAGGLKYIYSMKNDKIEGPYLGYHKTGSKWVRGFYRNGKIQRKYYIFFENNKYPIVVNYKNGKLIRKRFSASMKRKAKKIIAKPSDADLTPLEETIYREWAIYNKGIFHIGLDEECLNVSKKLYIQADEAIVEKARKKYSEFLDITAYDDYKLMQLLNGWAIFYHVRNRERPAIAVRQKTIKKELNRNFTLNHVSEDLGFINSRKIRDSRGFPVTVRFYDALKWLQHADYIR